MAIQPIHEQPEDTKVQSAFSALRQARELAAAVNALADELLGPMPTAAEAGNKVAPSPGILNELEIVANDTKRSIDQSFDALRRIRGAL
jgi:hypothetical protein